MPIDMNDHYKNRGNGGNGNGGGNKIQPPLQPPEFFKNFGKKAGILYALIIIIGLLVVLKPFVQINAGEVGIKRTFGEFDAQPLYPGLHFFMPVAQSVIVVDTRIRIINYARQEAVGGRDRTGIITNDSINVLDARGLTVGIELTIQYNMRPLGAPQTIATYGLNWEEKIINPVVRDVVRSVVGRFAAEELPTRRNEISALIETDIRSRIDTLPNQPVEVQSIQLREIVLPQKIKEQIEAVQIARQEAERARYQVEQAVQEAEKKAALAKGEAEANRINAQGIADKTLIEAKAQAQANEVVAKSLTLPLLELRQIDVQGKFNEALKENKDAKIFLTPGGAVPNIWVDMKDSQKVSSAKSQ